MEVDRNTINFLPYCVSAFEMTFGTSSFFWMTAGNISAQEMSLVAVSHEANKV